MKRIESEYRKAFAGVMPEPALRARTEAMVHTLGRSRTRRVRKALLCLALCVILLCATAVAAREFGLLSFWQSGYAGNQELLAALEPLLETVNAEYEGAVALTVSEALLSENSLALQYSVQNRTDAPLYIGARRVLLDGALPDAVGTGSAPYEQAIFPAGQSGTGVWQETLAGAPLELTTHTLELQLDIYRVPEGAPSPQALRRPVEETYTFLETARVAFPITARALETRTALHDGQPLEFAFDGYSLRVTRAEISATGAAFEWFLVFDSREAALAHNCAWDKHDPDAGYWDYRLEPGDGMDWRATGSGDTPEAPVQLESGEWAWRFAWYYTGLTRMPDRFVLTPFYVGEGGGPCPEESVVLDVR